MAHKLYTFHGHPRGDMIRVLAEFAKVEVELVNTNVAATKTEDFLGRHALGKIPFLETPEGPLFETNAICKYFGRKANLMGVSTFEEGQVTQWLDWINSELMKGFYGVVANVLGFCEFDEAAYKQGKAAVMPLLKQLNEYLNHHTYLAGEQITVADVAMFSSVAVFFWVVLDEGFRKGHVALVRWYKHIASFAQVKKFYRGAFMCKKEWISVKADKAEPKKKAETKKAEPKKAEKKAAPAPEAPPKKPKNPLDELPETSFNLFDFKTYIVNEKDRAKGIAEFWKQYDPKGWSIWHTKYDRYEGEGVKLFLTSNHKDSFLQRLDHFRKYSFGTYGVYGKEGDYEVEGVWVWRGTEIPQEVKDLPSYEYNFWNKLDHENPEHRKMLEDFWSGLENDVSVVNGRTARDVQWFK